MSTNYPGSPGTIKSLNLWIINIEEGAANQIKGRENNFNEIIEDFYTIKKEVLMKELEASRMPERTRKEIPPWHIIIKILNVQNKEG